ncbi:hypothetical protein CERZMDRAFT_80577 [Cercospora zeae-maydis SCOH1-5]|uniref:BTB domain-containing protein n=1 Tax=Cercospora zeae-maydis SCOH1-5 TaxID=717836 RepID=A0A6A6FXJ0_9PEZI|nr:hypothetical protein CERZMDRAFT_80577 [Cercospora zeae-maydis SCOH1-5]
MDFFTPIPDILERADEAIDFSSAEIRVIVGPAQKCFHVHESLIRKYSPYFKTALDGTWREGKRGVVEMVEDDEQAFNIYMNWLYRKKIHLDMPDITNRTEELDAAWIRLFSTYALGDKLLDSYFKDALTDATVFCVARFGLPPVEALHFLYDMTPPESPMRLLMTCELARRHDQINALDESWPHALTIDLTKLLKFHNEYANQPTFQVARNCGFHEHKNRGLQTETCYRANASHPDQVVQQVRLRRNGTIDFTTSPVRFSFENSSAILSINERLLRMCQPALDLSVETTTAGTRTLRADCHEHALNTYLNWLCSGRMYIDFNYGCNDPAIWVKIARAYALGSRLPDSTFKDALTDAVALMFVQPRYDYLIWIPSSLAMLQHPEVYQLLSVESPLSNILAHAIASVNNLAEQLSEHWPQRLLYAVAFVAAKMLYEEDPAPMEHAQRCMFHEHGSEEECYRRDMGSFMESR